jgi:hypothetical protein
LGVCTADGSREFDTIHARHPDIGHENVGCTMCCYQVERGISRPGAADQIESGSAPVKSRKSVAYTRLIINDQEIQHATSLVTESENVKHYTKNRTVYG